MKFEVNKKLVSSTNAHDKSICVTVSHSNYNCLRRIGVHTMFELLTKTRAELEAARISIKDVAESARSEGYTDWADAILRSDVQQQFYTGRTVHIDHINRKP